MPEVTITIGNRDFEVACREGEEHFLQSAAKMLDIEASVLVEQMGRIPEGRMLLMSGLMLADKTAGYEDKIKVIEAENAKLREELEQALANTKTVEVPVIPQDVKDTLAQIAARTEAVADQI